ncbi:hypothetical protein F9802_16785 [Bacillus aerolatus]|uniref:Uncharacterized protein n=1 Tax=Bacillus aerolatus TaxID=2653354 RepID=A0A6I1FCE4_9BACI|nr:DUF6241 domain-containing protein [Bacillus aerolatus]KAB7704818.1 hypothetical protein F9802_16785 [Bacillus aerolatus]
MNVKKVVLMASLVGVVAIAVIVVSYVVIMVSDHAQAEKAEELKKYENKYIAFDEKQLEVNGDARTKIPNLIDGNEPQVTEVMHKMTHQKILAHEKWGAIEMTPDNVKKVKGHVLANDFKSEKFFIEILNKWESGNFSRVDKDHNALWNVQSGTIVAAAGLMTEEQEQQFIEENFR